MQTKTIELSGYIIQVSYETEDDVNYNILDLAFPENSEEEILEEFNSMEELQDEIVYELRNQDDIDLSFLDNYEMDDKLFDVDDFDLDEDRLEDDE